VLKFKRKFRRLKVNENVFGDYISVSIMGISWPAEELRPLVHTVMSKIRCEPETRVFFSVVFICYFLNSVRNIIKTSLLNCPVSDGKYSSD
jgi:hypothetical protein